MTAPAVEVDLSWVPAWSGKVSDLEAESFDL